MRVGMNTAGPVRNSSVTDTGIRGRNLSRHLAEAVNKNDFGFPASGANRFSVITKDENAEREEQMAEKAAESGDRIEAVKVYEAAMNGGECPIKNLRSSSKVPYGHLAKDGVIEYKGVLFVCDELTNSICLGDMTDPKKVLNITLSGGGHLKVNRDNIGQLSKAIGMFSPEDVNLILRAIHQDTKIQSMQKEIEDLEAGVGEQITSDGSDADKTQNEEQP